MMESYEHLLIFGRILNRANSQLKKKKTTVENEGYELMGMMVCYVHAMPSEADMSS